MCSNVPSTKEKTGLFIEGKIEGVSVCMIIDTGSNTSIVTFGKDLSYIEPVPNLLKSVTGERRNVLGVISLTITVGNRDIYQKFQVADIDEDCILGLDFLHQQCVNLNIVEEQLLIGDVQVPLLHSPVVNDTCHRVVAVGNITIQPYTEPVINARIMSHPGTGGRGIVEPVGELFLAFLLVRC